MKQLVHSFSGDKNLVPFRLRQRKTVLKSEKVSECFVPDCLKISLSVFTCLIMHWNRRNDQFLVDKKSFLKPSPAATGTAFSPKFILDAKVQNNAFWKISYSGTFCNWVALNINLKCKWACWNTKIFRKSETKGPGPS